MTTFDLESIELIPIKFGGYKIIGSHTEEYSKIPQPECRLSVGLSTMEPETWTRRAFSSVPLVQPRLLKKGSLEYSLSMPELENLIRCIRGNNWWARGATVQLKARIIVESGGKRIATSTSTDFMPPVEPVDKIDITLALDTELRYPPNPGAGAMLFNTKNKSSFDGQYLFCSHDRLVIDPVYRGFDCSSFLRTTTGIFSDTPVFNLAESDHMSFGSEIARLSGFSNLMASEVNRSWLMEKMDSDGLGECIILVSTPSKKLRENHCVYCSDYKIYEFQEPDKAAHLKLKPAVSQGGFVTPLDVWRSGAGNEASYKYTVWG